MSHESEPVESRGLDRFTRNYLIFLGLVAAAVLGAWLATRDSRVGDINEILETDEQLSGYAYPFRVMALSNGEAQLSTPRSFQVPVIRFLGIIHPELQGKPQDHPGVVAAQEELVLHQKRAGKLVQDQPDVRTIRWVLDEAWYADRGLRLN